MLTWRDLGLERNQQGNELSPITLDCPYCMGHGNFHRVFRGESREYDTNIEFFSDVWQCGECAKFIFVIWRTAEGSVDYRVYPYDKARSAAHPSWPKEVGHAYVEAMNALLADDWDSSMVMARHTIGLATSNCDVPPASILESIAYLHQQGKVSEPLLQWARDMPQFSELKKEEGGGAAWNRSMAKEGLRFTRYFLDMLYTLPHDAKAYRPKS